MTTLDAPAPTVTGSVPAAALKGALTRAGRIAPRRSSNPLLTSARLVADGLFLTVTTDNLEVRLSECVAAPDLPPFAALVNAARAARVAGEINARGAPVPVTLDGPHLQIALPGEGVTLGLVADSGDADVAAFLPDHGPFGEPDGSIPAGELLAALNAVLYACSTETFQAVFRGVSIGPAPDGVTSEVAASDGYRVAIYSLSTRLPRAIIPGDTVRVLASLLAAVAPDTPALITVATDGNGKVLSALQLRAGPFTADFKVMDGEFPDYRRVVPVGQTVRATWHRGALLRRLGPLGIFADSNANSRIELTQRGASLSLSASSDHGAASATLPLETELLGAPVVHAVYNLEHLREAAQHAPGDVLDVQIKHADSRNISDRLLSVTSGAYLAVIVCLRV